VRCTDLVAAVGFTGPHLLSSPSRCDGEDDHWLLVVGGGGLTRGGGPHSSYPFPQRLTGGTGRPELGEGIRGVRVPSCRPPTDRPLRRPQSMERGRGEVTSGQQKSRGRWSSTAQEERFRAPAGGAGSGGRQPPTYQAKSTRHRHRCFASVRPCFSIVPVSLARIV
jgi:hypothetical protein